MNALYIYNIFKLYEMYRSYINDTFYNILFVNRLFLKKKKKIKIIKKKKTLKYY